MDRNMTPYEKMLAEMDARLKGAVAQRNAHKEHDHASITMGAKVDVWEQAIEIAHKYAPVASGEDVERVIEAIYYHDDVTITTDAARAAIAAMSRTSLGDASTRKDEGRTGETMSLRHDQCEAHPSPASPSEVSVVDDQEFIRKLCASIEQSIEDDGGELHIANVVGQLLEIIRPYLLTEPVISALNSRLNVAYIHARDIYTITPEDLERHGGYAIVNDCIGHAREIMSSLEAAGVIYVD